MMGNTIEQKGDNDMMVAAIQQLDNSGTMEAMTKQQGGGSLM